MKLIQTLAILNKKYICIHARQLCMWFSIHTTILREIFKEEHFCKQLFKDIHELKFL